MRNTEDRITLVALLIILALLAFIMWRLTGGGPNREHPPEKGLVLYHWQCDLHSDNVCLWVY